MSVVAAAHAAGADGWVDRAVTVQRIAGGANNALYRVEVDGQPFACKLCVADERQRARREYAALSALAAAGLDIASRPRWLDESCSLFPFPVVVYDWLPGAPLEPPLTAQHLAALLDSFARMHSIRLNHSAGFDLLDAWFNWFDFEPYLSELRRFLADYGPWLIVADPDGQVLHDRLTRLVERCAEAVNRSGVDPGRANVPLCVCHVDANLANTVWGEDGRLRWVDWEYSGWGDPALELSDLRWHAALEGVTLDQHAWLRDNYPRPAGDPAFDARLAVWDHLLVTRWSFLMLRSLWSQYNGTDRVRLTQPAVDPSELRARLIRFVDRAERLIECG